MDGDEHQEAKEQKRSWVRRHPWRSLAIGVGILFVLDIAWLPYGTLASYETERPAVTAFQQAYIDRHSSGDRQAQIIKEWVPYRAIPRHVVRAVLVSEDASFWQHSGFDTFEIHEALSDALSDGKDLRGASTITQQLVKNLFLSSSKDPLRKWHEVLLTLAAERLLTKRRILELYLNEIEWGPGVFGIGAAARYHFGVPAAALTPEQAAYLAAIIPRPARYAPGTMTPALQRRVSIVRRRMGGAFPDPDTLRGVPSDTLAEPSPTETDSLVIEP